MALPSKFSALLLLLMLGLGCCSASCLCKIHTLLPTIRPRGDLNQVNLPFFTISNQQVSNQ